MPEGVRLSLKLLWERPQVSLQLLEELAQVAEAQLVPDGARDELGRLRDATTAANLRRAPSANGG